MYLRKNHVSLFIVLTLFSLLNSVSFAHGEDAVGPHGGQIRMPANFHTELVPLEDGSFDIYLLDMQFKNPVVTSSEIKVIAYKNKKTYNLTCTTEPPDHFNCKNTKKQNFDHLTIEATRNGVKATTTAKYELKKKK